MASHRKGTFSLSRKRRVSQKDEQTVQRKLMMSISIEEECSNEKESEHSIKKEKKEEDELVQITKIDPPNFLHSSPAKVTFIATERSPRTAANLSQRKIEHFFVCSNYKDQSSKTIEKSKSIPSKEISYNKSFNKCPSYKWIPGTRITVDAFCYGNIDNCAIYCLTHFHSDHYCGLNKRFTHPIYCTKVTANLICQQLGINSSIVHPLSIGPYHELIDGIKIALLDANHCPGSVMMLFVLPNGSTVLHTGDFRFNQVMIENAILKTTSIDYCFLDTTYCNSQYCFPSQDEVISFVVHTVLEHLTRHSNTLIVCGAYTIGKEKIFMAVAQALGCRVYVTKDKYKILASCECSELSNCITNEYPLSTRLHVFPLNKMNIEELTAYLARYSSHYSSLLAIKPTGWTHSHKRGSLVNIKPLVRGPITIYGVPYSEHSSYDELKQFIQHFKPRQIVSTVGGAKTRLSSEKLCHKWLQEEGKGKSQLTLDFFIKK